MKEPSVRKFRVTPTQYELFRFRIDRPTTLNVELIATAPVNVLLVDNDERLGYEKGDNHTYTAAWGRRSYLEAAVNVDLGTWYLIIEGSTETSHGRLKVEERYAESAA